MEAKALKEDVPKETKSKKTEKPKTQLEVKRMPTRQQIRSIDWDVAVPAGTTIGDLLRPDYWAKVSGNTLATSEYAKVRVHWDDKTQYAEFYVRAADHSYAILELVSHVEFDESDRLTDTELYTVTWTGPTTKHRVIRKSDNQVMKDGFTSALAADDYIRTLGAPNH